MTTDTPPKKYLLNEPTVNSVQATGKSIASSKSIESLLTASHQTALQKSIEGLGTGSNIFQSALEHNSALDRIAQGFGQSSAFESLIEAHNGMGALNAALSNSSSFLAGSFGEHINKSVLRQQLDQIQNEGELFQSRFHRPLIDSETLREISVPIERFSTMIREIDTSGISHMMRDLNSAARAFDERFRPAVAQMGSFIEQHRGTIMSILETHHTTFGEFYKSVEIMRSSWIDQQGIAESLRSFASLQGIGHSVNALQSYGDDLPRLLRTSLGDWRDQLQFPPELGNSITARTDFYVERGVDTSLTHFPAEAFDECIDIVGLKSDLPIIQINELPIPPSENDDEEIGLARTGRAHEWLLRMEVRLRKFIQQVMASHHGEYWPKHRLPNGLYDKWMEKKECAEKVGAASLPPISYADFTDYLLIICKRDNWPYFEPYFGRIEDIRESFQRLHPIRLATAHARIITLDDQLLMYVEIKRITRALLKANS